MSALKKNPTILIRPAQEKDSRDLWLWRNDLHSRLMFVSMNEVSWEEHSAWFSNVLADPTRFLYIGETEDGAKTGVCRFDIIANQDMTVQKSATVSINLNPAMRGKKLSSILLGNAINRFWNGNPMPLKAVIKKSNIASIHCFSACGFVYVGEDETLLHYQRNCESNLAL